MDRPASVLICGSNYGSGYLRALAPAAERYRIAGLLARGSHRSETLARRHGIPLHRQPDSLPRDIDIACAAMNASASGVVVGLIDRGIHVLCEHPQTTAVIERALAAAERANVRFHLNGHFGDLPAPSAFIERCREFLRREHPMLVRITATDRSLWGALDILARALGAVHPVSIRPAGSAPPFRWIEGSLGAARVVLWIQSSEPGSTSLPDGSGDYLVDVRIEVVLSSGILSLLSVCGPVIWNVNLGRTCADEPAVRAIHAEAAPSLAALEMQRRGANLEAVDRLVRHAATGQAPPHQQPAFLLGVCRAWDAIGACLTTAAA